MKSSRNVRFSSRSKIVVIIDMLAFVAILITVLEVTNVTNFFHRTAKSGTIPVVPAASVKSTKKTDGSSQPTSQKPNSVGTPVTVPASDSRTPATPYGSFVSNHHPNLSGSPAPSTEQSVCTTTPGASCYIQFTQNGVVKKLASQVADSNGLTAWTWDVNQAGFTEGTWEITVVATINDQSKSAKDSMALVVGP